MPVLTAALHDAEPLVRGHAVWALAEIGASESLQQLTALQSTETDAFVLAELDDALSKLRSGSK